MKRLIIPFFISLVIFGCVTKKASTKIYTEKDGAQSFLIMWECDYLSIVNEGGEHCGLGNQMYNYEIIAKNNYSLVIVCTDKPKKNTFPDTLTLRKKGNSLLNEWTGETYKVIK